MEYRNEPSRGSIWVDSGRLFAGWHGRGGEGRHIRSCVTVTLVVCLAATLVRAQATREAEIAGRQAEKAGQLQPYEPTSAERLISDVVGDAAPTSNGLHPHIDTIYGGGG